MTETPKTPEEIEREIAAERDALAGTLGRIADRASFDSLVGDAASVLRDAGASAGSGLQRAAKDHPVALATAGAGLALLAFGAVRMMSDQPNQPHAPHRDRYDDGAPALLESPFSGPASALPEGTPQAATGGDDSASGSVKARAAEVKKAMGEGLETLGAEARERVMSARVQAYRAQRDLEAASRAAVAKTGSAFEKNPLAFGVGAAVAGAAVAAMLPRGREELRRHKAVRDKLVARAGAIFEDEKRKALAAVKAAAAKGEDLARKTASEHLDPDDRVSTSVPDAMSKITGAAKSAYRSAGTAKKESTHG